MLTYDTFINLLSGLVESLPQRKALSELGLAFAWVSLPEPANFCVSSAHLRIDAFRPGYQSRVHGCVISSQQALQHQG